MFLSAVFTSTFPKVFMDWNLLFFILCSSCFIKYCTNENQAWVATLPFWLGVLPLVALPHDPMRWLTWWHDDLGHYLSLLLVSIFDLVLLHPSLYVISIRVVVLVGLSMLYHHSPIGLSLLSTIWVKTYIFSFLFFIFILIKTSHWS